MVKSFKNSNSGLLLQECATTVARKKEALEDAISLKAAFGT